MNIDMAARNHYISRPFTSALERVDRQALSRRLAATVREDNFLFLSGFFSHETYFSAKRTEAQAYSRFSRPKSDSRWSRGIACSSRERSRQTERIMPLVSKSEFQQIKAIDPSVGLPADVFQRSQYFQ